MYKMAVTLDTGAGPSFMREDQMTLYLKTQVVHVSETTKIHHTNDKSLRIISSIKLSVHGGQVMELVNFLVCKRLTVPAILKCDICNQLVE